MKEHTFDRSDFRTIEGGYSLFEDLLNSLNIPEDEREGIDRVTVQIDDYEIED